MRGTVVVCHAMLPPVRASIDLKRGTTHVPRDASAKLGCMACSHRYDARHRVPRNAAAVSAAVD